MTGLILRPAGLADADRVAAFLHENMNRKIAPSRWRRILDYPWAAPDTPNRGHLLEAPDGSVRGFMGSVHAWRPIGGRARRLVNLTGWYVDKGARGAGHGLALIRAAMADGGDAYTLLTNSANTLDMVQALGFRLLDAERYLWRRDAPAGGTRTRIVVGRGARLLACPAGRRLIDDHDGLAATPVFLRDAAGTVTALFSVTRKGDDETWWDLLAATDMAVFGRCAGALARQVLPDGKSAVSADARFLALPPPGAERAPVPPTRLAFSRDLAPCQIDHAYSEIPLMGLKLD